MFILGGAFIVIFLLVVFFSHMCRLRGRVGPCSRAERIWVVLLGSTLRTILVARGALSGQRASRHEVAGPAGLHRRLRLNAHTPVLRGELSGRVTHHALWW